MKCLGMFVGLETCWWQDNLPLLGKNGIPDLVGEWLLAVSGWKQSQKGAVAFVAADIYSF